MNDNILAITADCLKAYAPKEWTSFGDYRCDCWEPKEK